MSSSEADDIVDVVIAQYRHLGVSPPSGKCTIIAAFVLSQPLVNNRNPKVISIASGSKCLPTARLSPRGDALHDGHAEVLSRRAALRWFVEEVARLHATGYSQWLSLDLDGNYGLSESVRMHMYISTVPCGDASTRLLASVQDEAIALLKDSAPPHTLPSGAISRGRDGYSLYGVLRTKPGRADSPPTLCMSCSDKIAAWNVLGIQGAMFSHLFRPVYLAEIIIGDVDQDKRIFVIRKSRFVFQDSTLNIDITLVLPAGFSLHKPDIKFTSVVFPHSRSSDSGAASLCNEALCWVADSGRAHEVLINGLRRGVPPKHRQTARFRPWLCKLSMFQLYRGTSNLLGRSSVPQRNVTYFDEKRAAIAYQMAKQMLQAEGAPFYGWVKSGQDWESFDDEGNVVEQAGSTCRGKN